MSNSLNNMLYDMIRNIHEVRMDPKERCNNAIKFIKTYFRKLSFITKGTRLIRNTNGIEQEIFIQKSNFNNTNMYQFCINIIIRPILYNEENRQNQYEITVDIRSSELFTDKTYLQYDKWFTFVTDKYLKEASFKEMDPNEKGIEEIWGNRENWIERIKYVDKMDRLYTFYDGKNDIDIISSHLDAVVKYLEVMNTPLSFVKAYDNGNVKRQPIIADLKKFYNIEENPTTASTRLAFAKA